MTAAASKGDGPKTIFAAVLLAQSTVLGLSLGLRTSLRSSLSLGRLWKWSSIIDRRCRCVFSDMLYRASFICSVSRKYYTGSAVLLPAFCSCLVLTLNRPLGPNSAN